MTDVARVPLFDQKKAWTKEPEVTFTELVRAHFRWERGLQEQGAVREEVRREFHEAPQPSSALDPRRVTEA